MTGRKYLKYSIPEIEKKIPRLSKIEKLLLSCAHTVEKLLLNFAHLLNSTQSRNFCSIVLTQSGNFCSILLNFIESRKFCSIVLTQSGNVCSILLKNFAEICRKYLKYFLPQDSFGPPCQILAKKKTSSGTSGKFHLVDTHGTVSSGTSSGVSSGGHPWHRFIWCFIWYVSSGNL